MQQPGPHQPPTGETDGNPNHQHPLAVLIADAAAGRFPAADGGWSRVPPWRDGIEAVVSFTAHSVFALAPDIPDRVLTELGADGIGGANDVRLMAALAGPDSWIDCLDMLLAARGTSVAAGLALADRPDLASHPRAQFAARIRDRPRFLGYADPQRSDLAVLSRGIGGLTELSFELEPGHRGAGQAAGLIRAALAAAGDDELVVAAAAPGNAASIRALLAAGFRPLGSVQLFGRLADNPDGLADSARGE